MVRGDRRAEGGGDWRRRRRRRGRRRRKAAGDGQGEGGGGGRPRNGQARVGQACAGPASGEGLEMRVRPGQVPHGQAAQGYLSDGRPWVPGRGTFIA